MAFVSNDHSLIERAKLDLANKAKWISDDIMALPFGAPSISNGSGARVNGYKPSTPAQGEKLPRFKLRTATDAVSLAHDPDWLVDKIVMHGGVTVLAGDPGIGKTTILANLAVKSSARFTDWLGLAITPARVLIIDEEAGPIVMANTISRAMRGLDVKPDDCDLSWMSLEAMNFRADHTGKVIDAPHLHDLIKAGQFELCIVDSLTAITPGAKQGDESEMHPTFAALRKIASETGCGFILTHHNNRRGEYRGTTAIPAAVDLQMNMKRDGATGKVTLETVKARHTENFTLACTVCHGKDRLWLDVAKVDTSAHRTMLSKGDKHVLTYLRDHGAATVVAISNSAAICSSGTARNAVYALTDKGLIQRTDKGGQGHDATYELSDKGKESARDV